MSIDQLKYTNQKHLLCLSSNCVLCCQTVDLTLAEIRASWAKGDPGLGSHLDISKPPDQVPPTLVPWPGEHPQRRLSPRGGIKQAFRYLAWSM